MLRLLRVMFPYMLLICLTAVFMGMLNARGHFFIPASGALVMNAGHDRLGFFARAEDGRIRWTNRFSGWRSACWLRAWRRRCSNCRRCGGRDFVITGCRHGSDDTVRRVVRQMIPGAIGDRGVSNQRADHAGRGVLGGPVNRGEIQRGGAADGVAAGSVRNFAGDVSAADALGPGGGAQAQGIPRHVEPRDGPSACS